MTFKLRGFWALFAVVGRLTINYLLPTNRDLSLVNRLDTISAVVGR